MPPGLMHLRRILRQVDLSSITKVYESGVRAFVIPSCRRKVLYAKCRPGPAATRTRSTPFWEASRHVEFDALCKVCRNVRHCTKSIVILFRVLPIGHPKAQVPITDEWALGAADMCKSCVERLKKMPIAQSVRWLTPDASSDNQLRPAVPSEPIHTASFLRYQHYKPKKEHC